VFPPTVSFPITTKLLMFAVPLTLAVVAETLVVVTFEIVTLPLEITTLLKVNPSTVVTVLPRLIVVVPITTLLLARYPLGKAWLTLVIVTLERLRLLMVEIVPPNKTEVLPIVMPVLKLESSCDRGIDPVADAKVYGTDI
jgi:hypothetical protein